MYRIYCDKVYNLQKTVYDSSLVNRLCYWAHGYLLSSIDEDIYQVILSHPNNRDIEQLFWLPNTNYYQIDELYYNLYSEKISYEQLLDFLDKKEAPNSDMELILYNSNIYTIDKKINQVLDKIEIRNNHLEKSIITDENYIGIHLRRGRGIKIDEITKSPYIDDDLFEKTLNFIHSDSGVPNFTYISDEQIYEFIENVSNIHPEVRYYISTDLPQELTNYFTKHHKEKIITSHHFKKDIRNISFQTGLSYEIVRGFFDLLSLAKCGKIIKTPESTYSEFASLYKKNEKATLPYDESKINSLIEVIFGRDFYNKII